MIALPISAAVESSVGDRNCHEKVVVGRRARLLSLALVVGAAFALALGGCVQLACRPASILVAKREERGRLDVGGGGLLRTTETGRVEEVQKPVVVPDSHKTVRVPFKVFRGMASLEAIVDRLDVEDLEAADVEALGAEGMEVAVPARGSVRPVIRDMFKHLVSAISYGGASRLEELQEMFRRDPQRYVIRLSESGRRESFER